MQVEWISVQKVGKGFTKKKKVFVLKLKKQKEFLQETNGSWAKSINDPNTSLHHQKLIKLVSEFSKEYNIWLIYKNQLYFYVFTMNNLKMLLKYISVYKSFKDNKTLRKKFNKRSAVW